MKSIHEYALDLVHSLHPDGYVEVMMPRTALLLDAGTTSDGFGCCVWAEVHTRDSALYPRKIYVVQNDQIFSANASAYVGTVRRQGFPTLHLFE